MTADEAWESVYERQSRVPLKYMYVTEEEALVMVQAFGIPLIGPRSRSVDKVMGYPIMKQVSVDWPAALTEDGALGGAPGEG